MISFHKVRAIVKKNIMYININKNDLDNKEIIIKEFQDLECIKSMSILTFKKEFSKLNSCLLNKLLKINNDKIFITLIEYGFNNNYFIESELESLQLIDFSKYEIIFKTHKDEFSNQSVLNLTLRKDHNFYCLFLIKKIFSLYLDELRYKLGFYYYDIDINSFSGELNMYIIADKEIIEEVNLELSNICWINNDLKRIALYKCKAILNTLIINPSNSYLINDANVCKRRDLFD